MSGLMDDERAAYVDGYAHALYDADTYDGSPWESCNENEKADYRNKAREQIELSRRLWVEMYHREAT